MHAYREIGKRQTNLLQNQLDALLVSRMEQAQRHAQSVGESLQKSVDESLRTAGEKEFSRTLRPAAGNRGADGGLRIR